MGQLSDHQSRWLCFVGFFTRMDMNYGNDLYSAPLDAKQRLALQEEKQGLETKLLGVCVRPVKPYISLNVMQA